MAVLQRGDIHVHTAQALRHLDVAPAFTLILRDFHCADVVVAHPFFAWLGAAVEDRQQPVAVLQHHDGLANKGAGFIQQGGNFAPVFTQILRLTAAHDGGILVAGKLGRPQQPQHVVRGEEQYRVLLRAAGVVRQLHRVAPLLTARGQT